MRSLNAKPTRIYTFIYRITGEIYTVKANDRIEALAKLRHHTIYPAELGLYYISYTNIENK